MWGVVGDEFRSLDHSGFLADLSLDEPGLDVGFLNVQ